MIEITKTHSPVFVDRYDYSKRKGQEDRAGKDLLEKIEKAGVYEVPIRTLIVEKDGIGIDDRSVDRLAESASRRGGWIHYPVIQKATNRVIVGKRRVLADKKAGKTAIIVRIVDVTDTEALLWRLEENAVRFKPDQKELYQTFVTLQRDFKMTQQEIADASGYSPGRVSQVLAWGNSGFHGSPGGKSLDSKDSESGKGGVEPTEPVKALGVGTSEGSEAARSQLPETLGVAVAKGKDSAPAAPDSLPVAPTKEFPEAEGDSGEMLPPSPPATPSDENLPPTMTGAASLPAPALTFSSGAREYDLETAVNDTNLYLQWAFSNLENPLVGKVVRQHLDAIYQRIGEALGK